MKPAACAPAPPGPGLRSRPCPRLCWSPLGPHLCLLLQASKFATRVTRRRLRRKQDTCSRALQRWLSEVQGWSRASACRRQTCCGASKRSTTSRCQVSGLITSRMSAACVRLGVENLRHAGGTSLLPLRSMLLASLLACLLGLEVCLTFCDTGHRARLPGVSWRRHVKPVTHPLLAHHNG